MKAKDANGLEIGAGDRVVCVDPGVGLGMSSGGYDVLKVVDPWTIVVDASTNQHVMAGRFTAIQPVLSVKEAREAIAEAEKAFAQVETSFEDAKGSLWTSWLHERLRLR